MGEKFNKLVNLLADKATLKQDVFKQTCVTFEKIKQIARTLSKNIIENDSIDHNKIHVEFEEINKYEFQLKIGSDIIVFMMKTNVFALPNTSKHSHHSYFKESWKHQYFGQIVVYDFIADSVKFNRVDDVGYLIQRLFINIDNHFLVEGLQNIEYKYANILKNIVDQNVLETLIEQAIYVSIDTDLVSTSYAENFSMTVEQRLEKRYQSSGTKVGFQMNSESE